ncbi:hypothetical protein A3H10_03970 [Candidatus Uhrbacteria bacterium RIFCSPLOWO2_12_FULL_46_10]|uniref:Glycosyltransferase 2-like domain-containing protein n=1 Tax=Candidatus Uhrbacteria bacterium RIFCSPLOWO2_01_FULL_47_25 TaxID=1802402 RepID=A0A1F7UY03_9BACT|nr:MAG: hypothetical protein A2752_01585 [Candidatus Uhrbacteria bacterium RIFCSPHIGHO2_01_FULL_46_23]OGL70638.1 MAG: hypothetical protein A3D60_04205 [Candidatus Uhrbacteria bacterium RIFCSPHIGHO2_02_FULL_47_29]OGL76404.1 MAG: hypothetical protein A3E96_02225 [Candidatus Uhrbacteria bacterium RIFCSPHIGHO2_12_FULL_46_13]OGL83145.1 MAG: hypothetical protein A2936_01430 [Candidatus Uhrbacteria bacterium RIFCSPLOWO2_01_FULL_47_25]OGL84053.1 MAG: hypothetical protein A3I37_01725 [Candidatus Uhrbact
MTLSIIIVNYRTQRLLRQCLRGIYHYPPSVEFEIIVVDNGSADGSVSMVKDEFPGVHLLALSKNEGYAKGSNIAIKEARGEFLLFMNADIAVLANSFDNLLAFMRKRPEVGMAGPQLLNPDRTIQHSAFRWYSLLTPFCRRTWLKFTGIGKNELTRFLILEWDHKTERRVNWLMSSCIVVRRQAIEDVGNFDERFFVYLSDTDLCRRFWLKNWPVVYTPESIFIHLHHRQSAEEMQLTVVHLRDWIRYLWKWRGQPSPRIE